MYYRSGNCKIKKSLTICSHVRGNQLDSFFSSVIFEQKQLEKVGQPVRIRFTVDYNYVKLYVIDHNIREGREKTAIYFNWSLTRLV